MKDTTEIVLEMADHGNRMMGGSTLIVPVLDNFEVIEEQSNASSFIAKYKNNLEIFINDGPLDKNTLDEKIDNVISSVLDTIKGNELYKDKKTFSYYKDYKNDLFSFKIYVQDIMVGNELDLRFVRQMNTYFVNPLTDEFCQLSMSSGPYKVSGNYKLINEITELDKDEIIVLLEKSVMLILDNLHYE